MTARRNPSRGLPLLYDPVIRLWLLRILIHIGGVSALLDGDRVKDAWTMNYLGLGALIPAPGPQTLFKDTTRRLWELMENLAPKLPTKPILSQNVSWLADTLGLSDVERDIIHLLGVFHHSRELRKVINSLGDLRLHEVHQICACALGYPLAKVTEALVHSGKLLRVGLVHCDVDTVTSFEYKITLLGGIADQLNIHYKDQTELFLSNFHRSKSSSLGMNDFAHLDADLGILVPYLKQALMENRKGVNVLFHGAPGTGKTEFARMLAQHLGAPLFEVATEDRYGTVLRGESRLGSYQLSQGVLGGDPCPCLLFDEIEDAFTDSGPAWGLGDRGRRPPGGRKAWVNRLLEDNRIPAIWVTNTHEVLDPAYIRRFDVVVEFKTPPRSGRARILDRYLEDLPVSAAWKARMASHPLIAPAIVQRSVKVVRAIQDTIQPGAMEGTLARLMGNSLEAMGIPRRTRAQVECPTAYRLDLLNADRDLEALAVAVQITRQGRLCLFGPPGTGKTAYGHYLAQRMDRPLHLHRASDLLGSYVGETEARMARMFQRAEEEGAVLLLDEADTFLRNRMGAQHSWEASMVNEMLAQMEAYEGIFVASTNIMEGFDPASLRRFDLKVQFDFLTPSQRQAMLEDCLLALKLPMNPSATLDVSRIPGLTPGDFSNVMHQARLQPLLDARAFVALLRAEVTLKPGASRRSIGFSGDPPCH